MLLILLAMKYPALTSFLIISVMAQARPSFESLPLRKDAPKASAWGLWGDGDELGTLNLLTSEVVKQSSAEVRTGDTIPLK